MDERASPLNILLGLESGRQDASQGVVLAPVMIAAADDAPSGEEVEETRRGPQASPSCGTKRAAELAAFPINEVVEEEVGHAQWVFTVPKMMRVYFLHHRELLGELSRAVSETVKDLLAVAAGEEEGLQAGVVSVPVPQ